MISTEFMYDLVIGCGATIDVAGTIESCGYRGSSTGTPRLCVRCSALKEAADELTVRRQSEKWARKKLRASPDEMFSDLISRIADELEQYRSNAARRRDGTRDAKPLESLENVVTQAEVGVSAKSINIATRLTNGQDALSDLVGCKTMLHPSNSDVELSAHSIYCGQMDQGCLLFCDRCTTIKKVLDGNDDDQMLTAYRLQQRLTESGLLVADTATLEDVANIATAEVERRPHKLEAKWLDTIKRCKSFLADAGLTWPFYAPLPDIVHIACTELKQLRDAEAARTVPMPPPPLSNSTDVLNDIRRLLVDAYVIGAGGLPLLSVVEAACTELKTLRDAARAHKDYRDSEQRTATANAILSTPWPPPPPPASMPPGVAEANLIAEARFHLAGVDIPNAYIWPFLDVIRFACKELKQLREQRDTAETRLANWRELVQRAIDS